MKRTSSVSSISVEASRTGVVDDEDIFLALVTLGNFDFATNTNVKNFNPFLEELVKDTVVKYLDSDKIHIRREAALTCGLLFSCNVLICCQQN
jgi:hypothetical protein